MSRYNKWMKEMQQQRLLPKLVDLDQVRMILAEKLSAHGLDASITPKYVGRTVVVSVVLLSGEGFTTFDVHTEGDTPEAVAENAFQKILIA